ncbi:MAG: hypothetical protein EXQ97_00680 [Alphaproteobacteria bacterium]|nr:hypothetical protein [Alphaproteobacteria bacterium]
MRARMPAITAMATMPKTIEKAPSNSTRARARRSAPASRRTTTPMISATATTPASRRPGTSGAMGISRSSRISATVGSVTGATRMHSTSPASAPRRRCRTAGRDRAWRSSGRQRRTARSPRPAAAADAAC